jgi:hypothetical protein
LWQENGCIGERELEKLLVFQISSAKLEDFQKLISLVAKKHKPTPTSPQRCKHDIKVVAAGESCVNLVYFDSAKLIPTQAGSHFVSLSDLPIWTHALIPQHLRLISALHSSTFYAAFQSDSNLFVSAGSVRLFDLQ